MQKESIGRPSALTVLVFLLSLLAIAHGGTISPSFLTTIAGTYEAGSVVLSSSSQLNGGSFTSQNTTLTFLNTYTATPQFGYGFSFISSLWTQTITSIETIIDITSTSNNFNSQILQLNFTASTVTLFSINYITCSSGFFMDVRTYYADLTSTTVYNSQLTSSESVTLSLPMRYKSNSSNTISVYTTIGLSMMRNLNTFEFSLKTTGYSSSVISVNLTVKPYNGMRFIRFAIFNYENIVTSINSPYFLDMGYGANLGGTVPDSSALSLTTIGTIFMGMVDWALSDSSSLISYNMSLSGLVYSLALNNTVTRTQTAYLWYRLQTCPTYYFNQTNLCVSCDYTCLTCFSSSNTSCYSCDTTAFRTYQSSTNSCPCMSNYTDAGVTICQKIQCSYSTCVCLVNNVCSYCLANLHRSLSNGSCVCDPYSRSTMSGCAACDPTCYTCSKTSVATACLSCSSTVDNRIFNAATNSCDCKVGYYESPGWADVYDDYLYIGIPCIACQYTCASCTSSAACLSCNASLYRTTASTGFCVCMTGYYDNLLQQTCLSCPYSCTTCSSSTVCLTCPATRTLTNNQCVCTTGYYQTGIAACSACGYSCYTCTNSTYCTSCNSVNFRTMSNLTCICQSGYYDTYSSQICNPCSTTCLTCTGANTNNCLTCDSTKYRSITLNNTCACMSGYYQTATNLCAACYYTCQTCTNASSTGCLTCNSLNYRIISGNTCICSDKYYDDGGNQLCASCMYFCLTCSSSATCLTCDSATRNTTNLATCSCLTGYYENGVSSSCQPCLAACLTCTNALNCSSCPASRTITTLGTCACNARTYEPYCNPCSYSCLSCLTLSTTCTTCNGSALRYLNTNTSQCICYQGYYDDGINQMCATCQYSCLTCSSASACLTCPTNRVMNGNYCSCLSTQYENSTNLNCLPCHYSCLTCSSYSQCTTCDSTNKRSTSNSTTLCLCDSGYYDNGVAQTCLPCSSICLTCSTYSLCLSCNTTANFYLSNGTCLCTTGYYFDISTSSCKSCHYSCVSCAASTSCTVCQLNRTLTSTYCTCNSGLFDNSATLTCTSCVYPCVTCTTTSTTCTSCDSTRTLTSSACLCTGATYDTGLNCSSCMNTCQTCTNSTSCTTCLSGSLRVLSSNLCVCPTGYHDQNGSQTTCLPCQYSCATCINSLTCSTCPTGRYSVTDGYCSCPTYYYYDNGVSSQCISCHFSCLTCSSISTNCTSCLNSTYRQLTNNTCKCQTGYYDDLVSVNCQPCHYSCQQCTGSGSCSLCNATNLRIYGSGPLCSCMSRYFDVSNVQLCSTCSYTCLTCISSTSYCLTCPATRSFVNSSSTCPCNNGYYDSGSPTCATCFYSCTTCNNGTACLTCPTTRLLNTLLNCQCTTGYYDVYGTATCATCAATCFECSTYQVCTLCDTQNNFRQLVNTSCVCPSGYYDASSSSNYTCQLCSYSCATCVSATQCTSCSTDYFRVYSIATSKCSCASGYYDNLVNAPCIPCPYDCLTCSNATVCLTCNSNRYLDSNNRCTCLSSYFANGTYCESCPVQCATCASSSNCTTCNGNRTLVNDACVCPTAFYAVAGSAACNSCQISCATCLTATQCSTCNSTKHRYLTSTYCLCMAGYYDDGVNQTCQTCYYSCLMCSNGTTCLTCNSVNNRVLNTVTLLCDCISGYYEDSNTKACIQCPYSCLTCTNGSACTSCNTNYNRDLNSSTNQCDCKAIGYYDTLISVVCAACDYTCLSCSSSATYCTTCLNTTYRVLSSSTCPCGSGYYSVTNQAICLTCSYKCVTCLDSSTTCTLCSTANYRSTTPACACITGFYDDGANATCATCNYVCESCANSLTCSTCNLTLAHRSINNVTFLCDCIANYYDNGIQICQSCSYSCLTCSNPTTCLTCPTSRALTLSQCICLQKYYDDYVSLECQSCNYTCQTCQNSSSCFSCDASNYRTFNSSTYLCSCMNKYYDTGVQSCSACDVSCFTCTNATSCATCPSSINKTLNSTTGSNYCVCLYGYYQNVTAGVALGYNSVCNPCYYACQTCSGQSTYCTLCSNSSNRYLKSTHQCACNVGFFETAGQQTCFACYTHCLTCTGVSSNNCLTCDNSTYFLNNSCYTSCPSFYNISSTTRTCVSCPSNCLTCVTSLTICSQCNSPYFIFSASNSTSTCVLSCPSYYYQVNNTCYSCNSPCLSCTAAYTCTSCVNLYYLSNGSCNPCNSLCLTCSGSTALDCITCISDYVLKGSICQKLTCLSTQYVQSISGCVNCTTTFPNSLSCLSTGPTSCLNGYILSNNSCLTCSAVTGYIYDRASGKCKDYCGDNIIITDLCDDGNTLNGDGCSSLCTIESGWGCTNNSCSLSTTPTVSVVSISNNPYAHSITLIISLSVGLRLTNSNFVLSFSSPTQFTYSTSALNIYYTSYQIVVVYYQSVQNNNLNIQIKSPASRLLVTSSLALSISLNLSVSIPVITNPPAIYISQTTSEVYSRYLFGLLMALHIIFIAAICFFLFKKIKIMLFIIDACNSITILYILTALGMYNVSLLSYESSRALQPFIYQFGSELADQTTNFYYFNYTSNFFSSCIIQAFVIALTYILSALSNKNDPGSTEDNAWHYYRTAFTFAFAYDFLLSCFSTFFWNSYNSYESSYSWMFAILVVIFMISEVIVYYSRMKDSKGEGKKVVPAISFITNDLQMRDKTNQQINIFDVEDENAKQIKSKGILSEWSDEKTEVILGENQPKEQQAVIMYFDLTPSIETQYSTKSRNHISAAHLPVTSLLFGLLFAIVANVQKSTVRSVLFLVISILYLLNIIVFKNQTLKSTRNIKLIITSLIYIILSIISLVISNKNSNLNTNFDIAIVSFVVFATLFNTILFIVSVIKSEAYRDYLINKKNEENMERNRRQNEARQKIYTKQIIKEKSSKNKATEQMISDFPESFEVKQPQIQQTQEQVEEKSFKLSDLKKKPLRPRDERTMLQERESSSIINNHIDAQVSDMKESDMNNDNFINEKNIFDIKGSYDESSPTKKIKGSRARAINNSQLSFVSRKEETPSLLFDNTLERIDEMKGVKRKVNKSDEKEQVKIKEKPKRRTRPKGQIDIVDSEEYYQQPQENRKSKIKKYMEQQKRESVDNFLQELDIPQGIKSSDSHFRSRMQSIDEISSIKQERMEYIEQEKDYEYEGSVFNKILQDYKKYSHKKIDRKKLKSTREKI